METLHLAALIASQWPALVRSAALSAQGNKRYWACSKTRLSRWSQWANYFEATRHMSCGPDSLRWKQLKSYAHEVLAAEILTRVWAATATIIDFHQGHAELRPYAVSVFDGHLDARQRLLRWMAKRHGLDNQQAKQLNTVRRRAERWTDLLLSHLAAEICLDDWAFEIDRVSDFALSTTKSRDADVTASLIQASLNSSLLTEHGVRCLHADLNWRIAECLLTAFGPDIFDATGTLDSIWQPRLRHRASDLSTLIDNLMHSDDA